MSVEPAAVAPRAITKLSTDVVNRIAAGEIIQRPANALKELLENALDAGATRIIVTVKEGGLKLLQIQDNGTGIRRDDLPILCERFTTSKIKQFDDLSTLATYGFRGEALASISHVAHFSATTPTIDIGGSFDRAAYSDGLMVPVKHGQQSAQPVPVAANDGTTITVEDLFYNTPTRLKALRSSADEYSRIVAVVLQYSIHNSGVSMVCKKANSNSTDVNTLIGSSVLDNIGLLYGQHVKRELCHVEIDNDEFGFKASGFFSGANYGAKKGTYLFFINHRLVDCSSLKRALESFYSVLLSKGSHPFVYLSIEIEPHRVDVNVHPTKSEVGFEDQDEIVELLCQELSRRLDKTSLSKTFAVQTLLPNSGRPTASTKIRDQHNVRNDQDDSGDDEDELDSNDDIDDENGKAVERSTVFKESNMNKTSTVRKTAPKSLVRTDHTTRTLDSMFMPITEPKRTEATVTGKHARMKGRQDMSNQIDSQDDSQETLTTMQDKERSATQLTNAKAQPLLRVKIAQSDTTLTSVKQLRRQILTDKDKEMDLLFKNHVFVGVVDLRQSLSMLQYRTGLYMFDHGLIAEELFYQLGLRQFGTLTRIRLQPSVDVAELVKIAIESEPDRSMTGLTDQQIIDRVVTTLVDAREMLNEYFSFSISEQGKIESLPNILPGYVPDFKKLPLFVMRLAMHVDWQNEKTCFETFLRELATFFNPISFQDLMLPPSSTTIPRSSLDKVASQTEAKEAPDYESTSNLIPDSQQQDVPMKDVEIEQNHNEESTMTQQEQERLRHTIEHVIVPAARQYLVMPTKVRQQRGGMTLLTTLESLYKVFERC
ncbi:DNA mismatch repair protein Mlh1 [Microbotryomycetes sp. JL221]|nr:DNA mismatch repair protein Mlh1 [Microbotryomycetes sp. JL221]